MATFICGLSLVVAGDQPALHDTPQMPAPQWSALLPLGLTAHVPPAVLRGLKSALTIVIAVYVGLTAYMFVFQARYIYFPWAEIQATPADINLDYEDVWLDTADGGRVHGWFIPAKAEKARGCVLLCHGNGGNISHRLTSIAIFHELGLATFLFDYRGYGQSPGRPSEKHTYADAEAAWNYLVSEHQFAPHEIVLFGRSLGGAIAAHQASKQPPGLLVLDSSFTSIVDMGRELYPYLPVGLLARYRYNTRQYLRQVKCPVLIIHSREDEMINFQHGLALYEAAPEPKRFIEIRGGHNTTLDITGQAYVEMLEAALQELFCARDWSAECR
jgi:pimeloyl-ACP methyl ester carboxylesterase